MMEQRDTIKRLCTAFPSLSISDARQLLEQSQWNFNTALRAAEAEEAKKLTKGRNNANFYAGDGQMTTNPEENPDVDSKELLDQLFKKAADNSSGPANDTDGPRAFYGQGRRLGHTANPSPMMAATQRPLREVVLEVYQNGFVLENGDFIPLDSKDGVEGMKEMNKGYVPPFLLKTYPNTELSITLQDKSSISYQPPAVMAFQGDGHKLSNATNGVTPSAAPGSLKPFVFNENEPSSVVVLVSSKGQRKEFKVNPDQHTVADLYSLARDFEPDLPGFILIVRGLPPRKLDFSEMQNKTIGELKLARAIIAIQK